jgi:Protein of unknown function (DUF2510)
VQDFNPWPSMGSVLPAASLLGFLALLALPFMAAVVFGLGTASIEKRTRESRRAAALLALAVVAAAVAPWLIVILQPGRPATAPSLATDLLTLLLLVGPSGSVPLVAYRVIGRLAFREAQSNALAPAGWYNDPVSGASLRWWNGSDWADPSG